MLALDEATTNGPKGSRGEIGTACKELEKNMNKFQFKVKIETHIPYIGREYLKQQRDLKMLHDLCWAIHHGKFETEEIQKEYELKPTPPMHSARWFTTYIRVLNCFARMENPSLIWIIMVTYILQAYAKNVFAIHFKPHIIYGSVHYNSYLRDSEKCLRQFKGKFNGLDLFKEYILPTFTRQENGCYAHPESVLLAAIASDDKKMAKKALAIYEKSLEFHGNSTEIRKFIVPTPDMINVKAKNCLEMLKWKKLTDEYITPPPLLKGLFSIEHIREVVNGTGKLEFPNICSHR